MPFIRNALPFLASATLLVFPLSALAKLPAPTPTPQAAAAVKEAAEKTAWNGKRDAYQFCQSQNRTAQHYFNSLKAQGKPAPANATSTACVDPGPFVPTVAKPLEAAGAHSPSTTAVAPPSSAVPAAPGPVKK